MKKNRFIDQTWFMWFAFIFLSPLGIYLMWKNKRFNKTVRIALSGFFSLMFLIGMVPVDTSDNVVDSSLMADKPQEQVVEDEKSQEAEIDASQEGDKKSEDDKKPEEDDKSQAEVTVPNGDSEDKTLDPNSENKEGESVTNSHSSGNNNVTGTLKVHFIDVGQADSILIQQGDHAMLIDGGNRADDTTVKSYLDSQGITDLEYVVGTHVHEDHIGGLSYIINSFKVGKVYFPRQTATTKVFESFVTAVKNKGLNFTIPEVGKTFKLGEAVCTILAPRGSYYSGSNDYSIALKVVYGNNSFLFTGDAEATSEMEMVSGGLNLKADVLKLGHHGSKTATVVNFLKAVNPKYAVVSVGKGNQYGLPNKSVMDRLKDSGIPVYRTDESGTIVATSDGNSIVFNKKPGSYSYGDSSSNSSGSSQSGSGSSSTGNSNTGSGQGGTSNSGSNKNESTSNNNAVNPPTNSNTVYWTPGGKSYHTTKSCRTLSRSKTIHSGSLTTCPKNDPCDVCH